MQIGLSHVIWGELGVIRKFIIPLFLGRENSLFQETRWWVFCFYC